jgi:putative phage-type endonuclease
MLQTDPAWLPARRGKLTASRMADAMARLKNGNEAEARRKLRMELLAERLTGQQMPTYVSSAMQRGLDYEQQAREELEEALGLIAMPARLVEHPTIADFAATPDGFIGDDALLEIKVPLPATFVSYVLDGETPGDYIPQMTAQLACARRKKVYFAAYCPEAPKRSRLFVREFEPVNGMIEKVEREAAQFLDELRAQEIQLTQKAA